VKDHTSPDQAPSQVVVEPAGVQPDKPDAEIDVAGLRASWAKMTDTHEFFGMLRRFSVSRTQALRLAGAEYAQPADPGAFEKLLQASAAEKLDIMIFVGNPGLIQIYSGPVHKVVPMGSWVNVLDPDFDLHVRGDKIDRAFVVRKPTADGVVTSLELYAANGDQIAHVVGKRKPGQTENEAWRRVVEAFGARANAASAASAAS
ncbi:MAG: hemin-degrading factor, partial [Proteobacteria bacterium]